MARAERELTPLRPSEPVRIMPAKEERTLGMSAPTDSSPRPHTVHGENHPKHHEKFVEKDGLRVPYTEVTLDDSPTGPNEPARIYRTMGPDVDPTRGLLGLRTPWITDRDDTTAYHPRG